MLAIDVGNTETVLGLFDGDQLIGTWRITTRTERTADELALVIRSLLRRYDGQIGPVAIASVVPPFTPILVQAVAQLECAATVIDGTTPLPIRLDVDEPLAVGADRIVNTLAASRLYARDTIAVDLGTATSFDCITGDGTFIGGVIAPGVLTGAETLVSRTAKLPRIDLKAPPAVIGRRTDGALRSGIFHNAVDGIDGIVRRIKVEWQRPEAFVVATGGLSPLIAPHCQQVQHIEPALTLHGLRLALDHLAGPRDSR